MKIEMLVSMNI